MNGLSRAPVVCAASRNAALYKGRGWRRAASSAQLCVSMPTRRPLARRRSTALVKSLTLSPTGRVQLAQRIHQVLVREIDHAIEVERLLADARYARDVLLVCDALPGSEAPPLAAQFRALPSPAADLLARQSPAGAPGHAQLPTDWSRDTSGFGVTRPPPVETAAGRRPDVGEPPATPAERRSNWLSGWRDSR